MATLQKIRSKGAILIIVIGLALFAFIAEEAFRSFQSTHNENSQRVGTIYGDHMSVQDFQKRVDEYADVVKFTTGMNSLNDEQMTELRDQVWNNYVTNELISHEAKKLGLTVTDAEVQAIISQGNSQLLQQTPFRNEKTGRFDAGMLKNFLNQYSEFQKNSANASSQEAEQYQRLYNWWTFIERSLREQTLLQKYNALLAKSVISNDIQAKMDFDARTTESNVVVAALPYTSIKDDDIKISDADLKAKYDENKEFYRQDAETRDIKYIDVAITASDADKKELDKEMAEYLQRLQNGENAADLVNESKSAVRYVNLPLTKGSLPADVALMVDSIATGSIKGPFYSQQDNSMNIVKMINKISAPDSIEFRQIQVGGTDIASTRKRADSIYTALKNGADFAAVAKNYGQKGDKVWISSRQYEGGNIDAENAKFLSALNTTDVNGISNVEFIQGNMIVQVTGRKGLTTKYLAAIIKRPIDFSTQTRNSIANDFNQFVASNTTLKDIEANAAKKGYRVQTREDMSTFEHNVGGVQNSREAFRWIFNDDRKVGDVSEPFDCGDDHIVLVAVTGIHKEGYRDVESVKDILKTEVLRDKKAEQLMAKLKDVKSIAQTKSISGAQTDTLQHVTFSAPTFVTATNADEPALSGSISKTAQGKFGGPVKGNAGVYVYQVLSKNKTAEKYDAKKEAQTVEESNLRGASRYINELYRKAKIKDNRYLFF